MEKNTKEKVSVEELNELSIECNYLKKLVEYLVKS